LINELKNADSERFREKGKRLAKVREQVSDEDFAVKETI